MNDREVLEVVIKKFEEAEYGEDYEDGMSRCPVCKEMGFYIGMSGERQMKMCQDCVVRFGSLFGMPSYTYRCCLRIEAGGIRFRDSASTKENWAKFRPAYLEFLYAKLEKIRASEETPRARMPKSTHCPGEVKRKRKANRPTPTQ